MLLNKKPLLAADTRRWPQMAADKTNQTSDFGYNPKNKKPLSR